MERSRSSVLALAVAGVAVGVMSEILVGSISETAEKAGLSEFFIGAIVVAIVGNAAEHWVAVLVARKDKMDLAVNIAIGSSAQIALFVAPVLVLASLRPRRRTRCRSSSTASSWRAVLLAVLIANQVTQEGESTWYEGIQLLARLRGARASRSSSPEAAAAVACRPRRRIAGARRSVAVVVVLLLVDLLLFARGRSPASARAPGVERRLARARRARGDRRSRALDGGTAAVNYITVYLIERTLSLDNLVRLPPALRVLRACRRSTAARCCSGASCWRSSCAASRSSGASS